MIEFLLSGRTAPGCRLVITLTFKLIWLKWWLNLARRRLLSFERLVRVTRLLRRVLTVLSRSLSVVVMDTTLTRPLRRLFSLFVSWATTTSLDTVTSWTTRPWLTALECRRLNTTPSMTTRASAF